MSDHFDRSTHSLTIRVGSSYLARLAEVFQTLPGVAPAEDALVYGHDATLAELDAQRLLLHAQQLLVLPVLVQERLEVQDAVTLEAAHVLMRRHAVGTQVLRAVGALRQRLVPTRAGGALERLLLDGEHVEHVLRDVVVLQAVRIHAAVQLDREREKEREEKPLECGCVE